MTAIVPDGATTTRTFEASDEDGVRKFIASHNATKNIYFTGNPCGRPSKKPTKADMTGAIFLHTDDDPRDDETPEAAKTRIMAGYDACDPPPSIVVDSGNGLQGFWLLESEYQFPENEKVEERVAEIELRNKALALAPGTTPGTHNHLPPTGTAKWSPTTPAGTLASAPFCLRRGRLTPRRGTGALIRRIWLERPEGQSFETS